MLYQDPTIWALYVLAAIGALVVLSLFLRWFLGISKIIGLLQRIANKLDPQPQKALTAEGGLADRIVGKMADAAKAHEAKKQGAE